MSTSTELLTNKFLEIINQLQTTVSAHGQEAINLALSSIQVDALGYILQTIVCFIYAFVIYKIGRFIFRKKDVIDKKDEDYIYSEEAEWQEGGKIAYAVIFGGSALVALLNGFINLCDIWNYFALVNPKLYLAHVIVVKVLAGHS